MTQQLRDGYVEACADEQPVSRQPVGAVTDRFDRDMMHYSQLRQALSGFPEGHRSLEGVWERTFEVWDEPPRLPSLWCGVPREERWPGVAPVTQEHRANRERFLARDELLRLAVRPPDRAYALEERLQSVQWTDQTLGCGDRVGFHLGVTRGEDGVAQLVTLGVRAGKLKPEENPS